MLRITEYEGMYYFAGKRGHRVPRNDYLRFEWDNGYLDIRKDRWEKLSTKKKNLILKLG